MLKKECKNCICLFKDEDGKWICDELSREISEIDICPERAESYCRKCGKCLPVNSDRNDDMCETCKAERGLT